MSFEEALALQKDGKLDKSLQKYIELINSGVISDLAYANAANISFNLFKFDLALEILKKGLLKFPLSFSINNEFACFYLDSGNYLQATSYLIAILHSNPADISAREKLVICLGSLDLPLLAVQTALASIRYATTDNFLNVFSLVYTTLNENNMLNFDTTVFKKIIFEYIEKLKYTEFKDTALSITQSMAMCSILIQLCEVQTAIQLYEATKLNLEKLVERLAVKKYSLKFAFIAHWHNMCWNMSIYLLNKGVFDLGWLLYEHGTLVPAKGPQGFQRAFVKPYSYTQVPIWKGEDLQNKSILFLGEQGIGDTMMFMTLVSKVQDMYPLLKIFVALSKRLISIYARSLPEVVFINDKHLPDNKFAFDFQLPLGSLPNRIKINVSHNPKMPALISCKNFKSNHILDRNKPIIGISWQGGGRLDRLSSKSIELSSLLPILRLDQVQFINLQYGDTKKYLSDFNRKNNVSIIHFDDCNPLKSMDNWLSYVSLCDFVITVANTTVHGSAGLNIPTFVLLNYVYDWRWTDPEICQDSYWYPSVKCFRRSKGEAWSKAISRLETHVLKLL